MKIQLLNGGLANQVFQYVFSRCGELSDPSHERWYLDDSSFFTGNIHNGYELERVFGLKPRLLSETFEPDVWQEYVDMKKRGYSIPQIFLDCGENIAMYAQTDDYQMTNPFSGHIYRMEPDGGFYPQILTLKETPIMYYHGSWVDGRWFEMYRDVFEKELQFPEIKGMQALAYEAMIEEAEYSVAVHIRRGDYVGLGLSLDANYYHDALQKLSESKEKFKVFVFSDDLYWCHQHSFELGLHFVQDIEYVSGNAGAESYVDLYLMSKCDSIIMANSAFSFLAALLDKHLDICVKPNEEVEDEEITYTPGRN